MILEYRLHSRGRHNDGRAAASEVWLANNESHRRRCATYTTVDGGEEEKTMPHQTPGKTCRARLSGRMALQLNHRGLPFAGNIRVLQAAKTTSSLTSSP